MIVPLSPVATIVFGEAATLLSRALVGAGRLVQFVPSGLIRTVPLSPVTRNKLPKTPTPCRSLVVGRGWMSCQTTPKVLMDWLVTTTFVLTTLVTITLVSEYGLLIKLPLFHAAINKFFIPNMPTTIE